MNMTRNLCLLALAACAMTGEAPTIAIENADASTVERLFAAGDPASVAWAAYHAARLRLVTMVPSLIAHLNDGMGKPSRDPEAVAASACAAALVDLRVPVEAGVPGQVWRSGARDAAVILAAADPARHRDWLIARLQDEPEGNGANPNWKAVANLLAGSKSPEALAAILGGLKPVLTVVVWDGKAPDQGELAHITMGDGQFRRLEGFPPLVIWRLECAAPRDQEPDAEEGQRRLLADGPTPIHALRLERSKARGSYGHRAHDQYCRDYRVELLASALGDATWAQGFPNMAREAVAWQDRKSLLWQVERMSREHQARWTVFTLALAGTGLIPARTPPPQLSITLVDGRTAADREPLPELPQTVRTW